MNNLLDIYTDTKNDLFQSKAWSEFYQKLGHKTWFISCDEDACLVIKMPLYKEKNYLYIPRGPQCSIQSWHVLLKKVKEIATDENCIFIRVEPYKVPNGTLEKIKFKKISNFAPMSRQFSPMDTLLLDLRKSYDELLSEMKPKGRYNIKVAERKGVKIRKSQSEKDLSSFYQLSVAMKERGFASFGYDHYKKLLESLIKTKNIALFVAEYDTEILSVIMVCFYKKNAIYLHGASSNDKREFMPNHLAQWEAIKEAKKRGCEVYDFWGIAPSDEINHSWAGITRFKKTFGGEQIHLLGAYDYTFKPFWYKMFSLINIIRKGLLKK